MKDPILITGCARSGVYEILCGSTGKRYIGSAVNLRERSQAHETALVRRTHGNKHLQNAWNKYGGIVFQFNILLLCNPQNLIANEQKFINSYSLEKELFNICPIAGSAMGRKHTEATKKKIALSEKGKIVSDETRQKLSEIFKGWEPPPVSDETRQKQSESKKGIPLSEDHKMKISIAKKGKKCAPFTDTHKKRMSEVRKGIRPSEEAKLKMSEAKKGKYLGENNSFYGKTHSENTRQKIKQARAEQIFSEESRQKMSESTKKWWQEHKKRNQ